jgi:nucleotide-binding universal stress UspA family protein
MKVLLAIDGSPHSQAAVTECAKQPWPEHTEVRILTVLHAPIPLLSEPTLVNAARDMIRDAAPAATVTTKIVEGVPTDAILEEAAGWGADLIVLGSHGNGRFWRTVLGSVSGAVVANAPCSVQVVRAKHLLPETESAA